MISTIALFKLISLTLDKIISEYIGSLPKGFINLASISQYINFVDDYKSDTRLEHLPVISSNLI